LQAPINPRFSVEFGFMLLHRAKCAVVGCCE
jgi:hypothetical protein